jgi:hypothetical protein
MYVQFPNGGHSDINIDLVVPAITQFVDEVLSGRLGSRAAEAAAG